VANDLWIILLSLIGCIDQLGYIYLETKKKLLVIYIRPMMTYASSAWAFIPKSNIQLLQAV
jgi:hypothetical protein